MRARAPALPYDYRAIYGQMMMYMCRFTAGDGMDSVAILKDARKLSASAAAQHPPARGGPG